jgi:hypothetical protein
MYPEITKEDYKSFTERYKGSDEEADDLISFYEEQEGDITLILECIMCSDNLDAERFVKFYESKIKEGVI